MRHIGANLGCILATARIERAIKIARAGFGLFGTGMSKQHQTHGGSIDFLTWRSLSNVRTNTSVQPFHCALRSFAQPCLQGMEQLACGSDDWGRLVYPIGGCCFENSTLHGNFSAPSEGRANRALQLGSFLMCMRMRAPRLVLDIVMASDRCMLAHADQVIE